MRGQQVPITRDPRRRQLGTLADSPLALQSNNLRPNGDHSDEQSQGRKGSSFFDNGADHDHLP